jgi:hypothetical protein
MMSSLRSKFNVLLLFLCLIVLLTSVRKLFAVGGSFLSPYGWVAGQTTGNGTSANYGQSFGGPTGTHYHILADLRGWGPCSSDMGCSWKLKNWNYGANFAGLTNKFATSFNRAETKTKVVRGRSIANLNTSVYMDQ